MSERPVGNGRRRFRDLSGVGSARGTAASTFSNATEKPKREMDPVRRIMEHAS